MITLKLSLASGQEVREIKKWLEARFTLLYQLKEGQMGVQRPPRTSLYHQPPLLVLVRQPRRILFLFYH